MSTSNTPNLSIPVIAGDDFVSKEELNTAFSQIDLNAVNKTHFDSKLHWSRWESSTPYLLKDIIRVDGCPTWGFLECTQAGTSGTTEPTGFYGEGDVRTDGGAKWTLRRIVSSATLSINADQVKYINLAYTNTSSVKQVLDLIPSMIDTSISESEAYTDNKISDLINGAGSAYDTLKELGDALNDDQDALSAINLNLSTKVDKAAGKGLSTNDYDNPAKAKVDFIYVTQSVDLDNIEANSHSHANKALLDSYTQTNLDLATAVADAHLHGNKSVLDNLSVTNGRLFYNGKQMATKKDAIKYSIVL